MAGVSYYRHDQSGYSIRVPLNAGETGSGAAAERAVAAGPAWGRMVQVKQILGRPGWGTKESAAGGGGTLARRFEP